MKKSLVVIVLVVVVGLLLTAASPLPVSIQKLQGKLLWEHNNICGVQDYVPLPVMVNVYLTGKFRPTNGIMQGCNITAWGYYYNTASCHYFFVDNYTTVCPTTR